LPLTCTKQVMHVKGEDGKSAGTAKKAIDYMTKFSVRAKSLVGNGEPVIEEPVEDSVKKKKRTKTGRHIPAQ